MIRRLRRRQRPAAQITVQARAILTTDGGRRLLIRTGNGPWRLLSDASPSDTIGRG